MVCLTFHTAIIINKNNRRITIKLDFENLSIFLKKKKQTCTHARIPPSSVFVRFQGPPPLLSSTNVLFECCLKYCDQNARAASVLYIRDWFFATSWPTEDTAMYVTY